MTALLALALLTGPPVEVAQGFDTPGLLPAGWVTSGGLWTVADGALRQGDLATRGAWAWLAAQPVADFDLRVSFTAADRGVGVRAAGLVFRAQSSKQGYYLHFDALHRQVVFVKQTEQKDWDPLRRIPNVDLATGARHTARVVAYGSRFQVYLDDRLLAEVTDETYGDGYVGLRAGQGEIAFDDFQLTGVGVEKGEFRVIADPHDVSCLPRLPSVTSHLAIAGGDGFFPVLVSLDDGSLGAVVRAGAPHVGRAGRLAWIRSTDGGRSWSEPVVVADSAWDDRNPAVGVMPSGAVVCAYAEATTYKPDGTFDPKAGLYLPRFVTSTDRGKAWSQPSPLAPEHFDTASPYGRIINLPDGTSLMPIYHWTRTDGQPTTGAVNLQFGRGCSVLRSRDGGRTWGDPSLVSREHNEFSLGRCRDGRLLAAMRHVKGGLGIAESQDDGRTWTSAAAISPAQIHPADLIPLAGDEVLLVTGCRLEPKGVIAQLSADGGRTWPADRRAFIAWDALSGDCGYPSAQVARDGAVVVLWYAVGTPELAGAQARAIRFQHADLRELLRR